MRSAFRRLSEKLRREIGAEIKMMLHCSRDTLRNQGVDTTKVPWDVTEGFYGEAFGVMRGLEVLNYGYFGPDNLSATEDDASDPEPRHNLKWWFSQLSNEVLQEEGWKGDNQCDWCLEKYGKDAMRSQSSFLQTPVRSR